MLLVYRRWGKSEPDPPVLPKRTMVRTMWAGKRRRCGDSAAENAANPILPVGGFRMEAAAKAAADDGHILDGSVYVGSVLIFADNGTFSKGSLCYVTHPVLLPALTSKLESYLLCLT